MLGTKFYSINAYADDIFLLAPSKTVVQFLIDIVSEYLTEMSSCINDEKFSFIVFRSKKSKMFNTSFKLLGQPLTRCILIRLLTE